MWCRSVRGQRKFLDVVDPDLLADAEATEVLQRLDAAKPRHRVEELHWGGGQAWDTHTRTAHTHTHKIGRASCRERVSSPV